MRFDQAGFKAAANYKNASLSGLKSAISALSPIFKGCPDERLVVVHLDDEFRVLQFNCYYGTADCVNISVASIVRDAAVAQSKGLLLAHNHPSGVNKPSESDLILTRRLAQACDGIDVAVLDHIIFAGPAWRSLRRDGYL